MFDMCELVGLTKLNPVAESRIREIVREEVASYFTERRRGPTPALSYYEYLRDRDEPPAAPPTRPTPNTTEPL